MNMLLLVGYLLKKTFVEIADFRAILLRNKRNICRCKKKLRKSFSNGNPILVL